MDQAKLLDKLYKETGKIAEWRRIRAEETLSVPALVGRALDELKVPRGSQRTTLFKKLCSRLGKNGANGRRQLKLTF